MKKRSKLLKFAKRLLEAIKNKRLIIILCCLVIVVVLMMILMLKQRDIGAREAGAQIAQLADAVRSKYKTQPDYWGLDTGLIIKDKIYPEGMSVNGGKLLGYFNNPVEVGMDASGSQIMPTIKYFTITYRDLTKEQCIALTADHFNQVFWLGVKSLAISNNNDVYTFDWNSKESLLPLPKKKSVNICRNGSNVSFTME